MRVDGSGPTIEELRTLLLLAELGGVGAVSRRLGIDGSVVSRRLRNLRDKYDLLRKQGGSLVLTERGRELLPLIRALIVEYEGLNATLNRKSSAGRSLTIAVGVFGAVHLIHEAVANYLHQCPGQDVNVRVCRGRERVLGVVNGRFDFAVLSHSMEQIRPLLSGCPVVADPLPVKPFVIIAQPGSPAGNELENLPASKSVSIRDFSAIRLVGLDDASGARTQIERQAIGAGIKLQFGIAGGGWLAAREYARHGLGAALIPSEALRDIDSKELVVRLVNRSLWFGDYTLHRASDVQRIARLKQLVAQKATEQCKAQEDRLATLRLGNRCQ